MKSASPGSPELLDEQRHQLTLAPGQCLGKVQALPDAMASSGSGRRRR